MTTPKDKFKPQVEPTPLSPHPIHQPFDWSAAMFEKLKQAYKRDVLGVVGVGSATVAAALWALPLSCWDACTFGGNNSWFLIYSDYVEKWSGEAQWVFVFALASVLLLIARAGNRR